MPVRSLQKQADRMVNLDADEGVFFLRQLESLKAKTYDVMYPELQARDVIPVSFDAGAGAKFITYRQYDMFGLAKIIANYASDLPRVDLKGKEFTANIRSLGASYGYSVQDIRSAQFAGLPLDQRKSNAAKRAILQLEDTIAFTGDSGYSLGGFLNNANITDNPAPNNAGATSTLWSAKTPAEILLDMSSLSEAPVDATLGVERPDTMIMPLSQFNLISNLQVANINMTVRKFFLENNPYIKEIIPVVKLKGAGAGATDMAMVYSKNSDKVTLEIPVDFEQFPVQEKGLEYEVPCHSRCGGVIWYYPLSAAIMHHI